MLGKPEEKKPLGIYECRQEGNKLKQKVKKLDGRERNGLI